MTSFARRCPRHVRAGSRAKLQVVRKLLSRLCDVNATHVKESNAHADEESQRALAKSRIDGRLAGGPRPERGEPLTQVPIEAISRVSPALDGDQVIIGDILSSNQIHDGANVIAVDRKSGKRRWITQVDSHPSAIITGSPVVFDGVVYLGVSSSEETLATNPAYPCCTFRGSVVALDARSGAMLWQTFDMPDNGGQQGGYSGGAVWQPPAIDPKRGSLFIGTGNNYLWGSASGGSVLDGPSIVEGTVYWGSGYRNIRPGTGNNKVYAFSVADSDDHDEQSDDQGEH